MEKRITIPVTEPAGYKAILGLEKYIESTGLTRIHKNLIKIRASQINGCAYCIDMHTKEARAAGETEQRIYALNAWRETPFFTEEERAVLAISEEVTLIQNHVSDQTYNNAITLLGDQYVAQVILAAITINAWNRIGIATNLMPALD
ncbi:carboxymuconolactone decarboxylase family protein [Dyadobacter sp. CY356]|uniref:carboxymuconolactone decarboxylase family protein n=1 Tax=Dyadobacter sp. CY356 TaxID=2906442 RepID=UPI001F3C8179|nr:carboxymuconolactone decarboxylase family protein [Dyadobacter sp. CY356]MCF0057087.1 carboxymuconolactone decarboxylase family protein [Dyadobacter sp. CY356]